LGGWTIWSTKVQINLWRGNTYRTIGKYCMMHSQETKRLRQNIRERVVQVWRDLLQIFKSIYAASADNNNQFLISLLPLLQAELFLFFWSYRQFVLNVNSSNISSSRYSGSDEIVCFPFKIIAARNWWFTQYLANFQ
jgi:hypothetical protein